jgi:N-acyl-D-aspartate/D-glutamate deacylase
MALLADPDVRRRIDATAQSPEAGTLGRLAYWQGYVIGDTFSTANAGLSGRTVGDIAAERGQDPFDALVDVVLADDLRTVLWPGSPDDNAETWALRRDAWSDPDTLFGGSDAGAHLDRMLGSNYTTALLADVIRGRRLISVEDAVRRITDAPARLFGLKGRGRVEVGGHADLVLIDPDTVDSLPIRRETDMPGGAFRLTAGSTGVHRVLVNGRTIVVDGTPTGELPGTVLRSGRDTDTVLPTQR